VLYDHLAVGGMRDGVITKFALSDLTDVPSYQCYTQHRFYKRLYTRSFYDGDFGLSVNLQDTPQAPGTKPRVFQEDEDLTAEQKFVDDHWDIAIAGEWNAVPRKPRAGDLAQPDIAQAIRDELTRQKRPKPDKVVGKVYIVDLDGDGSDEMIVEADSHDWHTGYPRDIAETFNCVLLLQQQQKHWHATSIDSYFPTEKDRYDHTILTLKGIYDIDGDGWMEMIFFEFIPHTDAFGYSAYRVLRAGEGLVAERWVK
jgi:hypothetical protein